MPKVWNKRDPNVPKDAVYVGRPTKWGNPYTHRPNTIAAEQVATREEAITKFREWFTESGYNGSVVDVRELRGKDLVCWCAPLPCHADVLLELANDDSTT